jgi:hypothetical protein
VSVVIVVLGVLAIIGMVRVLALYATDLFLYRILPILTVFGTLYILMLVFGRI